MKVKILAILFIFSIVQSCSDDYNQNIIGSWNLYSVKTNQKVINESQYSVAMKQLIKTTSITINSDHTFEGSIWGDTSYGYWEMHEDSLYIKDKSNHSEFNVYIQEITSNNLILLERSDSVVEILNFTRNNASNFQAN